MDASQTFAEMPHEKAAEILNYIHEHNKKLNREMLQALAQARKTRLVVIQRFARSERVPWLIALLSQKGALTLSFQVLSTWLLGAHEPMLIQFLDRVGVKHDGHGCAEGFPECPPKEELKAAVDGLLERYAPLDVAIYVRAFNSMNETHWAPLTEIIQEDPRLSLEAKDSALSEA